MQFNPLGRKRRLGNSVGIGILQSLASTGWAGKELWWKPLSTICLPASIDSSELRGSMVWSSTKQFHMFQNCSKIVPKQFQSSSKTVHISIASQIQGRLPYTVLQWLKEWIAEVAYCFNSPWLMAISSSRRCVSKQVKWAFIFQEGQNCLTRPLLKPYAQHNHLPKH